MRDVVILFRELAQRIRRMAGCGFVVHQYEHRLRPNRWNTGTSTYRVCRDCGHVGARVRDGLHCQRDVQEGR